MFSNMKPTFLFAAVDNVQVLGHLGAGVHRRVGVGEAELMVVAQLSDQGEDALYCAGACTTPREG